MQSIDQSIAMMLSQRYITQDQAVAKCSDPARMQKLLAVGNTVAWS